MNRTAMQAVKAMQAARVIPAVKAWHTVRKAVVIAALTMVCAAVISTPPAHAATSTNPAAFYIQLSTPQSPTRSDSFLLSYTVFDIAGRTITVRCYKKSPSDNEYIQFGTAHIISGGGNSGSCEVNNTIMNANATYEFRVEAQAESDSASDSVSVTYDTAGPGDVRDYRKEKTNSCEYTVHFKTADDSGVTARVEVYRSAYTSFYADHNSRIESVSIGSNEEKNVTNTIPECDKTYYYAVRAFDSAGNGSALVGDRETVTVLPTGTTGASGAILGALPVSGEGSILGSRTATGSAAEESTGSGEVKGESDITAAANTDGASRSGFDGRNLTIGGSLILLGLVIFFIRKKNTL